MTTYQHNPDSHEDWVTHAEYSCSMCIISLEEYFAFCPFPPLEEGVSVLVAIGAILYINSNDMYKRKE